VRRPGRITTGQKSALERLLPRYGIEFRTGRLDLDQAFGRSAPRVLDIGFGDGEALLTAAARMPEIDFLGVEVHEPGIGHLLALMGSIRRPMVGRRPTTSK
jgi:tRNA (guanine-N7-)-methyltransferase